MLNILQVSRFEVLRLSLLLQKLWKTGFQVIHQPLEINTNTDYSNIDAIFDIMAERQLSEY